MSSQSELPGLKLNTPEKPIAVHPTLLANSSASVSSDFSDIEFLCAPPSARAVAVASLKRSQALSLASLSAKSPFSCTNSLGASPESLLSRLSLGPSVASPTSVSTPLALRAAEVTRSTDSIELSQSSEVAEKPKPNACIFVGSLKSQLTDDDLVAQLLKTFSNCGKVQMVKVLRDTKFNPYAFVQFDNEKDALEAIKRYNGLALSGREIRCEKASVNRTIFVGPKSKATKWWSQVIVKSLCAKFGPIEQAIAGVSGSPFWFVQYVYREDAVRAYASLREEGKCTVDWVQNLSEEAQFLDNTKLTAVSVSPLPQGVTEAGVASKFSSYGDIEMIKLLPSRGNDVSAVIKYRSSAEAVVAIECASHTPILGRTVRVRILDPSKVFSPRFLTPPISLPNKCQPMADNHFSFGSRDNGRSRHSLPRRQKEHQGKPSGIGMHRGFETRKTENRKRGSYGSKDSQPFRFQSSHDGCVKP